MVGPAPWKRQGELHRPLRHNALYLNRLRRIPQRGGRTVRAPGEGGHRFAFQRGAFDGQYPYIIREAIMSDTFSTGPEAPRTDTPRSTNFPEFLSGFVTFTDAYVANAMRVVDDPEIAKLIRVLGATLLEGTRQLRVELLELYSGYDSADQALVERQIIRLGGTVLMREGNAIVGQMNARLSTAMLGIIQHIAKKILEFVLEIFGSVIPGWLRRLLLLIDELIQDIARFLSGEAVKLLQEAEENMLRVFILRKELEAAEAALHTA
jgi:hypothetical protein